MGGGKRGGGGGGYYEDGHTGLSSIMADKTYTIKRSKNRRVIRRRSKS